MPQCRCSASYQRKQRLAETDVVDAAKPVGEVSHVLRGRELWRTIPSWGLVAGQDKAIPPAAERWMSSRPNARKVVEVPASSHCAMLSHPQIVADLIDQAAKATS